MSKINIKPLNDKVLVEPLEVKEQKKGGIVIPDTAKEKPQEALVIAVGPGKRDDSGKRVPVEVKAGDKVVTAKYGGTDVKYKDKEYKLLDADDILGIVG